MSAQQDWLVTDPAPRTKPPRRKPKRKERKGQLIIKDGVAWLVLEFVAAPKKNSQRVLTNVGPRPFVTMSSEAKGDTKAIQRFCGEALGEGHILWPDEELEAHLTLHTRTGRLTCMVRPIGARPKGFTGRKRDISNVPELVLDAMQGTVMANDNQVGRLVVVRDLD